MKVLIHIDELGGFVYKYFRGLISGLKANGHTVTVHSFTDDERLDAPTTIVDPALSYRKKTSHYAVYAGLLDHCAHGAFDQIIIPRLLFPEFLLAELKVRPNLKTPICVGAFGFPDAYASAARAQVYRDLLDEPRVSDMYVLSLSGPSAALPGVLADIHPKVRRVYEPAYETRASYALDRTAARRELKIPATDTVVLYMGPMFFGKGLDLLEAAARSLPEGVTCLVASDDTRNNFDYPVEKLRANPRIDYRPGWISEEQMPAFFAACNVVALPYRRTYSFGSSAIFVQSMLAKRIVIAPNVPPFATEVPRLGVGVTFESEDVKDLTRALIHTASGHAQQEKTANFDGFVNALPDWVEFAGQIIRGAKPSH